VQVSTRDPEEEDIRGADLAFVSMVAPDLCDRVVNWCKTHRIPVNAMDRIEHCDLYYLSLLFRDPLVLAIGSGGDSPALSGAMRRWLDARVGPGWEYAAGLLAEARERLPRSAGRMELLRGLSRDAEFVRLVERDDRSGMRERLEEIYDRFRT
jgi:uroporphyrin-III C-methyltransferase/precorrin-2 dehydrogenase/sirohydrochlorin ferrochelatase